MKKIIIFLAIFCTVGFSQGIQKKTLTFNADSISTAVSFPRNKAFYGFVMPQGRAQELTFQVAVGSTFYNLMDADSLFKVYTDCTKNVAVTLPIEKFAKWDSVRLVMDYDIADTLSVTGIFKDK